MLILQKIVLIDTYRASMKAKLTKTTSGGVNGTVDSIRTQDHKLIKCQKRYSVQAIETNLNVVSVAIRPCQVGE